MHGPWGEGTAPSRRGEKHPVRRVAGMVQMCTLVPGALNVVAVGTEPSAMVHSSGGPLLTRAAGPVRLGGFAVGSAFLLTFFFFSLFFRNTKSDVSAGVLDFCVCFLFLRPFISPYSGTSNHLPPQNNPVQSPAP